MAKETRITLELSDTEMDVLKNTLQTALVAAQNRHQVNLQTVLASVKLKLQAELEIYHYFD